MNNKIQSSQFIAQTIKGYGVSHLFYIDAILRMTVRDLDQLGVKGIMPHTENAAGYMADGYARVSGKPGICMAQSIGSANLVGGVQDAWLAHSPVIAITGKKPPKFQYKNSYQETDHRLFYESITKFNAELTQIDQLPYLLRRCFRDAVVGKPGPVHLDITNEMGRITEVSTIEDEVLIEKTYCEVPAFRQAAEPRMINEATNAINKAKRPIIVVGRGAIISGASEEIHQLATKGDIPIVTSPDGKTIIDEDSPLWVGIVGNYGMDSANRSVSNSDLVIFIGTQSGDQTTLNWKVPEPHTETIHIDIDATQLGRNYSDSIGLLGDAKTITAQLVEEIKENLHPEWRKQVSSYLTETLSEYEPLLTSDSTPIRPERLCAELSNALPNDAIIVSDTGYSAIWSSIMLRMKKSQKYLRAAGSLGWAFPASIGVKCAEPERPVICFTGDGAFYYHLSEMETAVRYGIKTVTIINNNQVLGQCTQDIQNVYKDEPLKAAPRYTFSSVNFSEIANKFGCLGIRVENPNKIKSAMDAALATDKPVVVEVITDANAFVPPNFKRSGIE